MSAVVLAWLVSAAGAGAQPEPDQPGVAVLPFRVHSAKPIDYLGESLANLVASRLEASGRVRVLDPAAVEDRLDEAALRETRDSALRAIAEELAADYLVTGSLTELAGRYSLDVRVTPAAIGLESQTLVLTAERDDALLARVNEVADSVIEHVGGAAPALVTKVQIEGAGDLVDDLLVRLASRVGEPYDAAAVRDDMAMLRGEPAIANASVETERGPDGVALHFQVVRVERLSRRPGVADTPDVVADVRVRGNRRIEAAAILARVATRPGHPFRPTQIARDVREVNALGFFRNVRVLVESTPEGRVVIFEVEENPVVRQIAISGNESIDGDEIRDILTLTTGSTLDYPLLFENRERIGALYRAQGYYLAEVNYEIESLSEHSVGIHFMVEENKKLKLRKITFHGNEHFSDRELAEDFQTKRWRFWSYATSWFDHSGTYSEPLFLQDLQGIQKRYADAGFIQAEVGQPDVTPSPAGLEVSVRITEGKRFRVGSIEIAGDETIDSERLVSKLLVREGEFFNRSYLSESVSILTEHYADRGFYFADVVPLSSLSDVDDVVDVVFQVRKGPLYFVREVDISGNTLTVDPVIRREVQLVEGQLYSQRQLMISRLRIERLGFFEEVDLAMEPTEVPEQLDLEVHVVERPTGSFSFGAGFSSQDGFVATGSLAQSNLFGRGYAVNASVDYGGRTQRFFLSLTDPYFLGSKYSFGITGFLTSIDYESFNQEQLGGELVLGRALTEDNRTRGFLRYSYARRRLADESRAVAASLIFRELLSGTVDTSLLGLSVVSDTRDDRLAPTRGWNVGLTLDGAGPIGFSKFARLEGRALWYLGAPRWLLERSTFVVGTRFGYAFPFNTIGDFNLPGLGESALGPTVDGNVLPLGGIDTDLTLPLSERYFLGGLGQFQLRGFKARSVGPRRAILRESVAIAGGDTGEFIPVGRSRTWLDLEGDEWDGEGPPIGGEWEATTKCDDAPGTYGNGNGLCNDISDSKISDFDDLDETDVIGGNKFISSTFEYRFPISETLGLQGVAFFDTGNAFAEGGLLFDVTKWRYGTGVGVQWFSPYGPLAVILGFPLDKLSVEVSPVFEFSVGGRGF
ncbi:MAG: outer membrane protein assembly factor BamA [Deltaproteobacteria bacterium]|nr:outer membrane protein assembly factor BamA [Deltaproteobacteria bacterium]